jgi:hypothetical protein
MARKSSTIGPDYTGAHKPGFFAGPTDEGLAPHHVPAATTNGSYAASHVGKPKAHLAVPLHSSVTARQRAGMAHANASTPIDDGGQAVDSVHPFAKPAVGDFKTGRGAPANPGTPCDANGMACNHDLGRKVLAQAAQSGGKGA